VALTETCSKTLQGSISAPSYGTFTCSAHLARLCAGPMGDFRKRCEDIASLKTRNDKGEWSRFGSMVKSVQTYGPDPVLRYNGYPAAVLHSAKLTRPLLSSAQAMARWDELRQSECCPTA